MKFEIGMVIQHKNGTTPYKISEKRSKYTKGTLYYKYRLNPIFEGNSFSVTQKTINKNYILAKTYGVLYGQS